MLELEPRRRQLARQPGCAALLFALLFAACFRIADPLLDAGLFGHELGVFGGGHVRTVAVGVDLCELRSEEENLRRVVYPDEHNYNRTDRAERFAHRSALQIEGEDYLPQNKEHSGEDRAYPHVAP